VAGGDDGVDAEPADGLGLPASSDDSIVIGVHLTDVPVGQAHIDQDVREWWDEDTGRFRIEVHVANKVLGPLFGDRGSFTVTEHPCTDEDIPIDVGPVREEIRE
jgi:hypothetical protein